MAFPFKLLGDKERLIIIGATGSGKTQAALWQLSNQSFDRKPWIVYDFKEDDLIQDIEGAEHLDVADPAPERPGLYVVSPDPEQHSDTDVSAQLFNIYRHQDIGVYVDEGYMLGNANPGFRALLTQGRSKRIPLIVLCQRPVWMDRFLFSEFTYVQIFRLQNRRDVKILQDFIPFDITEGMSSTDPKRRLPQFCSYFYDAVNNTMMTCPPVPDADAILNRFDLRLKPLKKVV